MRSGRPCSMRREQARPAAVPGARARAERLWQETVTQPRTPTDDGSGSNVPLLTPALSSPRGGEAEKVSASRVPSPPLRAADPDGATPPRANACKRRAATRAERTIERSERPALEGNERVEERAGVRRESHDLEALRQPADRASSRSHLPRRTGGAQAAGALAERLSPGPDPRPLRRRTWRLAPPPRAPRRGRRHRIGRSRPAHSGAQGLACAECRRGLAAASLPRAGRAGAGEAPPAGARAGGAMALAPPAGPGTDRERGGARRLRRPLRGPRPRGLPPRAQRFPGRRPDPPSRQAHPRSEQTP